MTKQKKGVGFEKAGRFLDEELQRLIDFVNDRVVPATRQDGEKILRSAAEKLQKAADRLAAQKEEKKGPSEKTGP